MTETNIRRYFKALYHLISLPLFDLEKYRRTLKTQWLGHDITYFSELGSTNTYLKELDAKQVSHGQICLADAQTAGRGQYKRSWETEAGENLTFTLAFQPSHINGFHVLALACARAVITQIEDSIHCEAFVKWPNDVLINQKKVAGILTETVFNGNALDRLLIGIGLNINQQQFSSEIVHKATSLKQLAGHRIDREQFLSGVLSQVEYQYMLWNKQSDALLRSINKKIIGYGQWIRLQVNGYESSQKYKLLGINQKGQLTAVSKEGDLKTFSYEQIRLITN